VTPCSEVEHQVQFGKDTYSDKGTRRWGLEIHAKISDFSMRITLNQDRCGRIILK